MNDPTVMNKLARVSRWTRHGSRTAERPEPSPSGRPFWVEHWPIALVAVVAAALRFFALSRRIVVLDESLIYDTDSLSLGLHAFTLKIWHETTYNPGWAFVVWVMHRLFGLSTFWVRVPSALASTLAVVGVYAVARSFGLRRATATLAGAIMAGAIFQVEYAQQILPHAALPLGTCVCLWLVTLLGKAETQVSPGKQVALLAGLILVFGTLVFLHNSALLLVPPLLLYWGWSIVRPTSEITPSGPQRRFAAGCWVVGLLAFGFASFGWFFAKVGEADRFYLRPFFMTTFHDSVDRMITSDFIRYADISYKRMLPEAGGWERAVVDPAYFTASRMFDFLYGGFKLHGEQQDTAGAILWALPGLMVFLILVGAARGVRGEGGPVARRWVVCFGVTLGLLLILSARLMFPLGGIRHLICLSPFVVLTLALSFESRPRWLARTCVVFCLCWLAGAVSQLPRLYQTTRDNVGAHKLQRLARLSGVHDFIAGDTLCSEGALRLLAAASPDTRMLPSDDPRFIQLIKEHKPFFICSLLDPLFEKDGTELEPSPLLKFLADPMMTFSQYKIIPVVVPKRPIPWLAWTVYFMQPKPGPFPPEVAAIERYKGQDDDMPRSFAIRLTKPVRPEDVNEWTVRISPQDKKGGWNSPPTPSIIQYVPESQTILLTPRRPLPANSYVLTLERKIRDTDGRRLDAQGDAFYLVLPQVARSRAEAWSVK